jgi:hypothetical protein
MNPRIDELNQVAAKIVQKVDIDDRLSATSARPFRPDSRDIRYSQQFLQEEWLG